MEKATQKQLVLENNVIEIYQKVLKNDKERSQFLLKIFKFLIENDENFKVNDKLEGIFVAVKPSLKVKEFSVNWGGKRDNAGKKINTLNKSNCNQVENQLENEVKNQDISSSFKEIKYKDIKYKEMKYKDKQDEKYKDIKYKEMKYKDKQDENEKEIFIDYEFCKKTYEEGVKNKVFDFKNFDSFWIYYKDKGILKTKLHNLMISWDINQKKELKQEHKETKEETMERLKKQYGVM